MATVNILLAMHCPAGAATFRVTGDATISRISCGPGSFPACTVNACKPDEITIRNTIPDQGDSSDHLAFNLEVDVGSGGGEASIACDGPGMASGWFIVDGDPTQYSCPTGLGLGNGGSTAHLQVNHGRVRVTHRKK